MFKQPSLAEGQRFISTLHSSVDIPPSSRNSLTIRGPLKSYQAKQTASIQFGSESNNIITVRESQDTFRLFVGWLYQGSNALLSDPEYKSHPQRLTADLVALWSFAETFKIEALRNDLVDSAQRLPLNDNFFQLLISLDEWASATAQRRCGPIVDYMYDKLAYEITSKGWGHFMSVAGTAWTEMMHNPRTFKGNYITRPQETCGPSESRT
ncbi:hypothetical protein PV05_07418 [Exophiala xenobiotica]|uniref:Uncharacterized protein n=1 Tax=Exophiala xenobiotica TaxID=348802 RepID=A0A0D2EKD7_9EURO|nr:uncharacterized protein PV05_07418 [Exophiala xenobiotica]KIW55110.1 hypothetical protein PV05_07418 [Exophiala xenobiotica]